MTANLAAGAQGDEGVVVALGKRRKKREPFLFPAGKLQKVHGPADANAVFARRIAPGGVVKAPRRRRVASGLRRKNRRKLVEVQGVGHFGDGFGFETEPRVAAAAEAPRDFLRLPPVLVRVGEHQKPQLLQPRMIVLGVRREVGVEGGKRRGVVAREPLVHGAQQNRILRRGGAGSE